jgi:hypothetical protein
MKSLSTKKSKQDFLKAVLSGDRKTVSSFLDFKNKIIFVEVNGDETYTIIAPCLGWVHENIKTLTKDKYDELVIKHDLKPMEFLSDEQTIHYWQSCGLTESEILEKLKTLIKTEDTMNEILKLFND